MSRHGCPDSFHAGVAIALVIVGPLPWMYRRWADANGEPVSAAIALALMAPWWVIAVAALRWIFV